MNTEDRISRLLKSARSWPARKGKSYYLDHLSGKTLTRSQSILAKCYECCGGEGGVCTAISCPLFQFSQYRESKNKTASES